MLACHCGRSFDSQYLTAFAMQAAKASLVRQSNQSSVASTSPKNCHFAPFSCSHDAVEGFRYCIYHILEDKNAPYKPCTFNYPNTTKTCTNAVRQGERKDGLCLEHAKLHMLHRMRSCCKKRQPESIETYLGELQHHVSVDGNPPAFDLNNPKPYLARTKNTKLVEYASESDSDAEYVTVDQTWKGDLESEPESIDSDVEDPLRHAGIYTAEEVASITREKLMRLQSLYVEQCKRLQLQLKDSKRKFTLAARKERETLGPLPLAGETPADRKSLQKLRAMQRYHKHWGREALLHRHVQEKRVQALEGSNFKPPIEPKCVHVSEGFKCTNVVMPLSRYCAKHILQDRNQNLFRKCGAVINPGDEECGEPVPNISDHLRCALHRSLLPFPDIKSMETIPPAPPSPVIQVDDEASSVPATLIKEETPEESQVKQELELEPDVNPAESSTSADKQDSTMDSVDVKDEVLVAQ